MVPGDVHAPRPRWAVDQVPNTLRASSKPAAGYQYATVHTEGFSDRP